MMKSYDECLDIVKKTFLGIPDLKAFCRLYKIDYSAALNIKNGKTVKAYPGIITKILEINGYSVSKKLFFDLKKNNFFFL